MRWRTCQGAKWRLQKKWHCWCLQILHVGHRSHSLPSLHSPVFRLSMWPNRKYCLFSFIHWIHAPIRICMQYLQHNIDAIYLYYFPSMYKMIDCTNMNTTKQHWLNLFSILLHFSPTISDTVYFKKLHNSTKWIIQCQQRIRRAQYHCSIEDVHRKQIQMLAPNQKTNRIEKRNSYDIRPPNCDQFKIILIQIPTIKHSF